MIDHETKNRLEELKDKFSTILKNVDLDNLQNRLEKFEKEMSGPDVWADQDRAKKLGKEAQILRDRLNLLNDIKKTLGNIDAAVELSEDDPSFAKQAEEMIGEAEKLVREFELSVLLNDPYDSNNGFLTVHPGAGGTESQDWASMLFRMYSRWAEKNSYEIDIIEEQPGDEAGLKSATINIKGPYAYGKLKYEAGVHRLVRLSPFDANHRRHTSFASVSVSPEMDDDIDIEIKPEDLRIDTYRAGGAGGQHVNRTESAVRITHLPTGIVVTCQKERSQHQNKHTAMKLLKAKLFEIELEKKREEKLKLRGEQKDIAWGSQIRSYVFQPYTMVKDHRTGFETGNIQSIMDGNIDDFIEKELLHFSR
ncbi:MAG: peptide chain release factor 2 [Kosmotogaceae bacterium]